MSASPGPLLKGDSHQSAALTQGATDFRHNPQPAVQFEATNSTLL